MAGRVEKGLASEGEYNSKLEREDGAVSRALHKDVNKKTKRKCAGGQ